MLAALARFCAGYLVYRRTGRTPTKSYWAMRQLHARTDGRFNDLWLWFARALRPHRVSPVQGFLGSWSVEQLQQLAAQVERDGIAVLDRRLPQSRCAELEAYARRTPSLPLGRSEKECYRSETASALRYDVFRGALPLRRVRDEHVVRMRPARGQRPLFGQPFEP